MTALPAGSGRAPDTPDFDIYPVGASIASADIVNDGAVVRVSWSDGRLSRYHAVWLRDNATDSENLNPETREQWSDVTAIPPDLRIDTLHIAADGFLVVGWRQSAAVSRFHPGWLLAHDYSNPDQRSNPARPVLWDAAALPSPPTFEGASILTADNALESWLAAAQTYGISRLRNVDPTDGMVARVAERVGPVRDSNFGRVFDVRVQTGPGSNAYSGVALTPHTDLPTREYEPGLQFLHCLENSSHGGQAIMVDGYRLAQAIAQDDPAAYRSLTQIQWPYSNRAIDTDYRWHAPVIKTNENDEVTELRVAPFLRAPLDAPFGEIEEAYRSLRLFFEYANNPHFQQRFDYVPGDLICMDNRRLLHGRTAYEPGMGHRWLQGCYSERDELNSRLRILARQGRKATSP